MTAEFACDCGKTQHITEAALGMEHDGTAWRTDCPACGGRPLLTYRCNDCGARGDGKGYESVRTRPSDHIKHRCQSCRSKRPAKDHPWRGPLTERASQSRADEDKQRKFGGGEMSWPEAITMLGGFGFCAFMLWLVARAQ